MNQDDFKKLLDKALEPVRKDLHEVRNTQTEHTKTLAKHTDILAEHTHILAKHTDILAEHTHILAKHTDILAEHTDILARHTDILENQVLPSVITTETEIKVYADMYKINNSNSKKLEKRIAVLEDESGVIPPPEFTLVDVQ